MTTHGSEADTSTGELGRWRQLAVARSLDAARTRAEDRIQRFLDAALELIEHGGGKEFTVQEVVERSGQSLRSFYQYFGGKHELLLALFGESVHRTADLLREKIAEEDDALERLHRFIVEYYRMCRVARGEEQTAESESSTSPILIDFAQQLLTVYPTEAANAFLPLVSLFEGVVAEAVDAGVISPALRRREIAGAVLQATMFNTFSATIVGGSLQQDSVDAAEELWDLMFNGLRAGVGN